MEGEQAERGPLLAWAGTLTGVVAEGPPAASRAATNLRIRDSMWRAW